MTYEQMKELKPGDFKRACGVYPRTFETMLQVLPHVQGGVVDRSEFCSAAAP